MARQPLSRIGDLEKPRATPRQHLDVRTTTRTIRAVCLDRHINDVDAETAAKP